MDGAVVSKELMAIAQVRWLLENRTALSPKAVDDMLRKYNAELLRRDIKSALAAVLEDEHYNLQYSREVSRLARDVAAVILAKGEPGVPS